MNLDFSQEDTPLGTGGALRLIKEKKIPLHNQFFVINGDTYLDTGYKDLYGHFKNFYSIADALITGCNTPKNNLLVKGGRVKKYGKDGSEGNFTDGGVILIKKEVLDYINPNKKVSFEEEIYPILINKRKLMAMYSKNSFYDIGTEEGLKTFREIMK